MSESTKARAKVAALRRSRTDDDPELLSARRSLAEANIAAAIRKNVAAAPPLTSSQKANLTRILYGAATDRGVYNALSDLAQQVVRPAEGGAR